MCKQTITIHNNCPAPADAPTENQWVLIDLLRWTVRSKVAAAGMQKAYATYEVKSIDKFRHVCAEANANIRHLEDVISDMREMPEVTKEDLARWNIDIYDLKSNDLQANPLLDANLSF